MKRSDAIPAKTPGMFAKRATLVALATNLTLFLGCAAGFPGAPAPQENTVRTTLDNGLKVMLVEDHGAPVVALNVWVRVGSADERTDQAGMAHVFEHMLFKGTERRAVGEIARTIEAAGGMVNAFTSFDMTVYHITMASRDVGVGIDVLADAVQHSTFDAEELAREQEVVVEELKRSNDSPGRMLSRALFETTYKTHPYRLPVIGTEESVRSFGRENMLEFFGTWYVPNNMTFVAVGDFDSKAVLEQIRTAFAGASHRDVAHPRTAEPSQTGPRTAIVHSNFQQTLFGIAWPITAFAEDDTAYLDLLSMVLGSGETSRLYRSVKDRNQLVHQISASAYTPRDAGIFSVDAVLEAENLEAAIEAALAEVDRLRASGPSEAELDRVRTNLLSGQVHEKETVEGQARKIGYYEALADGLEAEAAYLERVRNATTADLQRVAVEYLGRDRTTLAVMLADGARPDFDDSMLLAALDAGYARRASEIAGEEVAPGIFRYTLANGLRVIVKPNRAIPLVSMRLAFLGGLLAESESTQGFTSFLAEMVERGSEQRSAAQFASEIETIAGSLGGFSGRNSFGLTGEFLTESLDTGLELFADMLLNPAFPADEIEKVRREREAALKRREDNLSQKAFELFQAEIFPDHPYRFPMIGSADSLASLDRAALVKYWDAYAHPSNGVLAVVGDVDPAAIVAELDSLFAEWTGPPSVELPRRAAPVVPTRSREKSIEKNKSQVHVVLGFPGLPVDDPDVPALDVLSQVLAGQGGRLFLELRDRQSLAYSVTAFSLEGVDPGFFAVYIASAPDKLDAAVAGLRAELQRTLDEPFEPSELDRARRYLAGSHAVSLQRLSSQASLLSLDELYGLGAARHLGYAERIDAVTHEDVKRVARRLIDLERATLAIVK